MSYNLRCEVRSCKGATDKYGKPCVDIVLRTDDFSAVTLNKYVAKQEFVIIQVVEND